MITGGDVQFNNNSTLKYVYLVIVVLIVLYIVYKWWNRGSQLNNYLNNTSGDTFDENALRAIEEGERLTAPTAVDHYRLGTVYLINARQPENAHRHYNQALNHVIQGDVDLRVAPFIIDGIADYNDMFMEYDHLEELPIQEAMFAHYEARDNMIEKVKQQRHAIKDDDPEKTQKLLLNRIDWQSDSQNVHDSALDSEMVNQFNKIRIENMAAGDEVTAKGYDEAIAWARMRFQGDKAKRDRLEKVINTMNQNYPIDSMPGIKEQDIVTAVWQRIHDKRNKNNVYALKESFADAMLDCVEGNHIVCMAGRKNKVWQSLARLDCEENTGIVKTKQALRNELYERSAAIVDSYVGANGKVTDQLREAYNNSEDTAQVNDLIETIHDDIDKLREEYSNRLDKQQLDSILEECKAVV